MFRLGVLYSTMIALATGAYLLSPPPRSSEHYCGATVHLGRLLSLNVNCDSMEFIDEAIDPAMLLHPGASRQERPLFVLSAALLTHLLMATGLSRMAPARVVEAFTAAPAFKKHYEKHHLSLAPRLYAKYVLCAYFSHLLIVVAGRDVNWNFCFDPDFHYLSGLTL